MEQTATWIAGLEVTKHRAARWMGHNQGSCGRSFFDYGNISFISMNSYTEGSWGDARLIKCPEARPLQCHLYPLHLLPKSRRLTHCFIFANEQIRLLCQQYKAYELGRREALTGTFKDALFAGHWPPAFLFQPRALPAYFIDILTTDPIFTLRPCSLTRTMAGAWQLRPLLLWSTLCPAGCWSLATSQATVFGRASTFL